MQNKIITSIFVLLSLFILVSINVSATDELLNGLIAKYKFENTAPLSDSINSYNLTKDSPVETTSGVIGYAINLNASTCGHIGYCDTNYCFNFNSNTCIVCDIYDQCSDPNDCWSDDYSDCFPADMLQECFNNPIDEIDCGSYCFVESNKSCIPSNYSQVYSYDSAFKLDSEFTINAWVYKTASSNWLDQIVGSGGWTNPDYYGYTFAICTDPICVNGNLTALIFDGDADFDFFTGGDDIIINEWLMATMVFSNSNNYLALYFNGTLISNNTLYVNPVYYTGDFFPTIMLGQANLGTATNFYGFMDELAFINRTWSSQEVEWVYNSEVGGTAFEFNASLPEEACTPNWSCSGYDTCLINNTQFCNATYDNNVCGENYSGDFSEFEPQVCDGSSPFINLQNPSPDNTTVLTSPILDVIGNITNTNLTYIQYAIENSTSLLLFYSNNSLINKTFFDLAIQFNMSLFENGYYYYSAYVEDSVLNRDYINATFLLNVCHPLWVCSGYEMFNCSINDTRRCNAATDINMCNITYEGNFSEFELDSCNHCTQSASYAYTLCFNHSFEYMAFDLTWGSCCNVTKLESDCVKQFDFGTVNFTNVQYPNGTAYCSGAYQPTYETSDLPSIIIDSAGGVGAGSAKLATIIGVLISLTFASIIFIGIKNYIFKR
jgi:hypothetical protein